MMTHDDYHHQLHHHPHHRQPVVSSSPVHEALSNVPRYASSSDMSTTSSTFDLGSEQQEGKYMCLRIQDHHNSNNSNQMTIWSEKHDHPTNNEYNNNNNDTYPIMEDEEERRNHGLLLVNNSNNNNNNNTTISTTGKSGRSMVSSSSSSSTRSINSTNRPGLGSRFRSSSTRSSISSSSRSRYSHDTTTTTTQDVTFSPSAVRGCWSITGRMDSLGGRVYLKDEKGHIMAVVVREHNAYAILGLTPVYEHQPPYQSKKAIKMTDNNNNNNNNNSKKPTLYMWATVTKKRRTAFVWRESYTITREDDKTSYITKECGSRFGARKLKVLKDGRTCGLIEQFFTNGNVTNSEWKVQVGMDIGPRAMVCFLAIVNKSTGRLL